MFKATDKFRSQRKNYLRPCSKIDPLNHFRKVTIDKHNIVVFTAHQPITFGDFEFGQTFRHIRKKKGHYNYYDIEKYEGFLWNRLGYKERIFNHGVKRIYHFLDNEFFFGELFFSDLRKIDHEKIAKALLKKYAVEKDVNKESDIKIIHQDGFIYFENSGINLSIKYISTKNIEINQKLEKITNTSFFTQTQSVSDLEDLL